MAQIQSKILLDKQEGETPLEVIERFKKAHTEYKDLPMTYAGRLDPMASGLLVLLAGEKCKQKDQYLKLDKTYEMEVLFGISTDTGDVLGLVTKSAIALPKENMIKLAIKQEIGKVQDYPAFSSRTIEGKSLWQWAREGIFKKVEAKGIVTNVSYKFSRFLDAEEVLRQIEMRTGKVKGDFRQEKTIASWRGALLKDHHTKKQNFLVVKLVVETTSGAYVRVFAENIGKYLGLPSLAWSIRRTKIGDFSF